MPEVLIGVDLGGTRIRAARLDKALNILQREDTLTLAHEGLQPTIERIKALIHKVMPEDKSDLLGIGVSAPGPLNPLTGVVVAPPNLPGWHEVPLAQILRDEFDAPIYVGNDANVAALAEVTRGAAQGYRHVIFITVSTGVGSGVIYDGRLLLGKVGLGGEAGHMIMVADGGQVSTLELQAAGPALARRARAALEDGATSIMTDMVGGDLGLLDASIIGRAAADGDELAQQIVDHSAFFVGLGIVSLLHLFNPEVIVIGGGVSKFGDGWYEKINATVQKHALDDSYWRDLKIVPAGLAGAVSIIGAAALVLTQGGQADVTQVAATLDLYD
ncbi:ROK family protein [Phototrophicus methaneseepsis]|uniref:ROK family protein n=1 Tax=Phototrophicus methaneseepsis TaxID=2710758 RepID=A0A7S8E705_9CHLR|nr:ROK family protein [Phototrophicus methaneseepsis]QPC81546.1 ROK family protein [Phototrophicus methaneseepsis]